MGGGGEAEILLIISIPSDFPEVTSLHSHHLLLEINRLLLKPMLALVLWLPRLLLSPKVLC